MSDPTPNLPLLRKILDHIDAHPEEWDQEQWGVQTACGTAYCIAGHAAVMSGRGFRWNTSGTALSLEDGSDVEVFAADKLGLTDAEACDLFEAVNSRDDVQRMSKAIAARAGEAL